MLEYLFTKTPLVFFVQNLWRDEAFSYLMAVQPVGEILRTTALDFNPPLYYLLLHWWIELFGSSEVALRSLSLVFFAATAVCIFEIVTKTFKIPTARALVYMSIVLTNPFLVSYAFEARMYMMVTFFITLSYYALWSKKPKIYIFSMIAAFYTHYFSVFIFAIHALSHLLPLLEQKNRSRTYLQKRLSDRRFIIPVALYLPWLVYLLSTHDFHSSGFWILQPAVSDLVYLPLVLFTGYERVFGEYYHERAGYTDFHLFLSFLIAGLTVLPFIKTYLTTKHSSHVHHYLNSLLAWAFLTPLLIFAISHITTPLFHPRYYIFSVPGLLLLLIVSIELLQGWITKQKKGFPPLILTSLLLVAFLGITARFNTDNLKYHSKRNVSRMYAELHALKKPQDKILLRNDLDYPLALYYTKLDTVYIWGKSYEEIPAYVGKVLIPQDAAVSEMPQYPARAFLVGYDTYDIRSEW